MPLLTDSEELNEFRLSFVQSSQEKVDEIEGSFLKLEKVQAVEEAKDILRKILTKLHSIKGAARAYVMVEVATICHKLEDYCFEISEHFDKDSLNKKVESMLYHLDALNSYFGEFSKNKSVDTQKFKEKYSKIFIEDHEENKTQSNIKIDAKVSQNSSKKLNVLQIGLTKPILKQVKFALSGIKHKLSFCSDPTDAFYRISQEKFDLILVTNILQPIDGLAFSAAIKLQWGKKAPKVFLLSSTPLNIEQKLQSFIDSVLVKNPTLPKELRKNVLEAFYPTGVETPLIQPTKDTIYKVSRVFCIDDDENILNLVSMLFEERPQAVLYSKVTKNDPTDALLAFRPDLVVCDLNIPGIDMRIFLKKLLSLPELKNIKVVFLTGDANDNLSKDLMSQGALGVFDKSILLDGFFDHFKKIGLDF